VYPFETIEFPIDLEKKVLCAKKGKVLISITKISEYTMGKVAIYPQSELRELQYLKQHSRKQYDQNPNNEKRLQQIKKLKHNYDRSLAMLKVIQSVGLNDSQETVNLIIEHLLNVGQSITLNNRVNYKSQIIAPNGTLIIQSTWKILPDNQHYLVTINLLTSKE
jgi:hypothetical protein